MILQQHDRLPCGLDRQFAVRRAVVFAVRNPCVLNHLRRIEHTQLEPRHEETPESAVDFGLGDQAGAKHDLERALAIYETKEGPNHPDVARPLDALATLARRSNDLDGAQELLARVLSIKEANLGKDHPELINAEPYGAGWLIEIEPTDDSAAAELLDAAGYGALIQPT